MVKFIKKACLFFCLAVCFGCSNDTDNPEEQSPIEAELQWQLTAIVENGTEVATPGNYKYAYLILEKDGAVNGRVGANLLKGRFNMNPASGKISFDCTTTELGSLDDDVTEFETMYMTLFHKITSYIHSGDELKLYYGDNCYLQYQSKEIEKREEQPTDAIKKDLNWKLVKLVEAGDEVKIPEELLNSSLAYTIQFMDDGSFKGYMSANWIEGSYTVDQATGKAEFKLEMLTQMADLLYGYFEKIYLDLLFKQVYAYSQSDDYLYLYYGKDNYLMYQPKYSYQK